MNAHGLRAPANDGGLLIDPPWDRLRDLAGSNAAVLSSWDDNVQGRAANRLRVQARREVIGLAREFLRRHGLSRVATADDPDRPLIVTGHQPELFHPGVWVKNFAAANLARSTGGVALNLIVDNDIPKAAAIRVPTTAAGGLRTLLVDFDQWRGEIPYEDWKVSDEAMFASFGTRARDTMAGAVADPLLDDFWPRAIRRRDEVDTIGLRFSLARREIEASWGFHNLEIPLGRVCQTDSFLWFASHLLAQLPRYQQIHNACLEEYRAAHRLRSRHHPVAALARQGDWLEAPFWVWRTSSPRRRALLARRTGKTVELRIAGEMDVLASLPLPEDGEACCAVERLRDLPANSVRLRTRALTTTMFARHFLGDLFIHGIGGAKYDELGDEISRRFFGFEPPGFLTLSLTLRLGLPVVPVTAGDLQAIDRTLRDLIFNPDRHVDEPFPDELRRIIEGKRAALAAPVTSRGERIARTRFLRQSNLAMQPWVEAKREELRVRRQAILAELRSNRIAGNREFAAVLHSSRRLREILGNVGGRSKEGSSPTAPAADG